MFLHFVWLHSYCSPFLLSQCSWGCMPPPPPPPPFNALDTCLPLPFNALVYACLSPASLQCSWVCIDCCLQISWCISPASLPLWFRNSSVYLLQITFPFDPILFYPFWFPIIIVMRRNNLLVSHVLFMFQHCSPIFLACSTYQKSMNFSHNSVK